MTTKYYTNTVKTILPLHCSELNSIPTRLHWNNIRISSEISIQTWQLSQNQNSLRKGLTTQPINKTPIYYQIKLLHPPHITMATEIVPNITLMLYWNWKKMEFRSLFTKVTGSSLKTKISTRRTKRRLW